MSGLSISREGRRLLLQAVRLAGRVGVTLFGLLAVTFVIGRVIPVDPVLAIVGDRATPDVYEATRQRLGLDLPLWQQFANYLANAARGDFGASVLTGKPVMSDIVQFFPATAELATVAIVIGTMLGIGAGVAAAATRGRWPDQVIRLMILSGASVPIFWLGIVGLVVFYAKLGWVEGPGRISVAYQYSLTLRTGFLLFDTALAGDWDAWRDVARHIILPASILGLYSASYIARMTRGAMIGALSQDYILTARAKGLSTGRVLWGHAFRSTAAPILTTVLLAYAYLLEGAVLTETVFSWPGLGLYVTQSLFSADLAAVLGATVVVGLVFIALNLVADIVTPLVDPRIR